MEEMGLVHIYRGDGKGKTTAAVGLAVRCAGGGGRVLFYQFLKNGESGEIRALESLENVDVREPYALSKFTFCMTPEEKEEAARHYGARFGEITDAAKSGKYDLLVLDEILDAVGAGLLSEEKVSEFLRDRPAGLEVVLTGREAGEKLTEVADYITDMKKVRHPFDKGIKARKYIEM